jgi:hypothetical protein
VERHIPKEHLTLRINRRDALVLADVTVVGGAALAVAVSPIEKDRGDARADSINLRAYDPQHDVVGDRRDAPLAACRHTQLTARGHLRADHH